MRHGLMMVVIALAVSGCGGAGSGKAQTIAPSSAPPAGATLPKPTSNVQCDAPSLAYLVGHPRTDIPVPVDPSRRRVACASCEAPDDYRADRTDILFDAHTGRDHRSEVRVGVAEVGRLSAAGLV